MIQVTSPGAASKNRAPNWRTACSQAGAGGGAAMTDMARFWHGNRSRQGTLVTSVKNLQRFDGPTFEAEVLRASEPVVVDFYADWCGPCRMMEPAVEALADEYAGRVTIGKL